MRRREFVTLLGGAAAGHFASWPFAAHAQQPKLPLIGYLGGELADLSPAFRRAFLAGLGEAGYVEGRNVAIEYRWSGGQYDRRHWRSISFTGKGRHRRR